MVRRSRRDSLFTVNMTHTACGKLFSGTGAKPALPTRNSHFSGRDSPTQAFQYVDRFHLSHETSYHRCGSAGRPASYEETKLRRAGQPPVVRHAGALAFVGRRSRRRCLLAAAPPKCHDPVNLTNQSHGMCAPRVTTTGGYARPGRVECGALLPTAPASTAPDTYRQGGPECP